ncbi:MAG TPA: hypothetical protein VFT13_01250 [Candidatus Krumholzibacteria bacterium]|nr:hypothetical protein [Candidatus Krumholzibacteria bacterium]
MKLSTHYYVLTLSENTNRLYEAFRDNLIDIQNTWFPLKSPARPALNDAQLRTLLQTVDHSFAHYYSQDPLGMILAGTERNRDAFASVTAYPNVIIGKAEGDYSTTSLSDLGRIVWPIVKGVMASAGQKMERDLETAEREHNVAVGIDEVVKSVDAGIGVTLLVEDGYRVQLPDSDALIEDCDNVVDVVIDKVLALRGNVIFVEDDSLSRFQQIALILRHQANGRSAA